MVDSKIYNKLNNLKYGIDEIYTIQKYVKKLLTLISDTSNQYNEDYNILVESGIIEKSKNKYANRYMFCTVNNVIVYNINYFDSGSLIIEGAEGRENFIIENNCEIMIENTNAPEITFQIDNISNQDLLKFANINILELRRSYRNKISMLGILLISSLLTATISSILFLGILVLGGMPTFKDMLTSSPTIFLAVSIITYTISIREINKNKNKSKKDLIDSL